MNSVRWICTFTRQTHHWVTCVLPPGVGERVVAASGNSLLLRNRGQEWHRVAVERIGEGEGQWVLGEGWGRFISHTCVLRPCIFYFEQRRGESYVVRVYEEYHDYVCNYSHGFLMTYTGAEDHGLPSRIIGEFSLDEGVNVLQVRGGWQGYRPLLIRRTGDVVQLDDGFRDLMEVCTLVPGDKVVFQYRGDSEWVVRMFQASGVEINPLPTSPLRLSTFPLRLPSLPPCR